jgi:hypothetical protein
MCATVLIEQEAFGLFVDNKLIGSRRALDAEALRHLTGLASRYGLLGQRPDPAAAFAIGRDLYRWVDGDQRQLGRLLEDAPRPLVLDIHCPGRSPAPAQWALLQAPWELLADEAGYLAVDALLQFSPQRHVGPLGQPAPLDDYRLGLAFMAAAPGGTSELDYEAEEAAILDAVGDTNLDLLVEESGEANALGRRLSEVGALPVLHLSCHGHNAWRDDPDQTPRPVLLLEDGAFGQQPTDAAALLRALRPAMPRLLFLSACLSAAAAGRGPEQRAVLPPAPGSKESDRRPEAMVSQSPAHSLTSALILAGMPAVIGWDGTVADAAATQFAATLYQRLADREVLALAVAEARRALLEAGEERIKRNWHLARLWLGSNADGAAPLVAGSRKRSLLPADHGQKAFLGKEVPVASHAMFVGRRRELQGALRVLDEGRHAGVILTGMGRLGKSSLAARIANRRREDFALAVLHGHFGVQDFLEKLSASLKSYPLARELICDGQEKILAAYRQGEEAVLIALGDLLTDLLSGPCQQRDANGPALLLVLDDFEQLLEESAGARPVSACHAGLLATILRAFDPAASDSRLLITSRFPFRLAGDIEDLAGRLVRIELSSFGEIAERKLLLRQQAVAQELKLSDLAAREALLSRARIAARGNPGLQDLLIARLMLNPAVPLAAAEAALVEDGGLPGRR